MINGCIYVALWSHADVSELDHASWRSGDICGSVSCPWMLGQEVLGINPVISGWPAPPPQPQPPSLMCQVGSREETLSPPAFAVFTVGPVHYSMVITLDHTSDVLQGVIRFLRWLMCNVSAPDLCIADRTNNVLCLSYRGSWFLWLLEVWKWKTWIWTFVLCSFWRRLNHKEVHAIAFRAASEYWNFILNITNRILGSGSLSWTSQWWETATVPDLSPWKSRQAAGTGASWLRERRVTFDRAVLREHGGM